MREVFPTSPGSAMALCMKQSLSLGCNSANLRFCDPTDFSVHNTVSGVSGSPGNGASA